MDIERIGIVGGGLMGSDIAEICGLAGLDVVVREVNEAALDGARLRIGRSLERAVKSGKIEASVTRPSAESISSPTTTR